MDENFVSQLAHLEALDKLIEKKASEYLNPERILAVLTIDYKNVENLQNQQSKFAADFLFYNSLAAKLRCMQSRYEDTVFNKIMAHYRKYASMYLTSIGKRDTKDALSDYAMWMFSKDVTDEEKHFYATSCQKKLPHIPFDAFYRSMYRFKPYEDLIEEKSKFEYRTELADSLADAIKQVNICASQIVKLRLSGSGEAPSVSIATVTKIRNIIEKNKNISDEQIQSFV